MDNIFYNHIVKYIDVAYCIENICVVNKEFNTKIWKIMKIQDDDICPLIHHPIYIQRKKYINSISNVSLVKKLLSYSKLNNNLINRMYLCSIADNNIPMFKILSNDVGVDYNYHFAVIIASKRGNVEILKILFRDKLYEIFYDLKCIKTFCISFKRAYQYNHVHSYHFMGNVTPHSTSPMFWILVQKRNC